MTFGSAVVKELLRPYSYSVGHSNKVAKSACARLLMVDLIYKLHLNRQSAMLGTLQLRHECPFSSIWRDSISIRPETPRSLTSGYILSSSS